MKKAELIDKIKEVIKEYRLENCDSADCYGCCHACNFVEEIDELIEGE